MALDLSLEIRNWRIRGFAKSVFLERGEKGAFTAPSLLPSRFLLHPRLRPRSCSTRRKTRLASPREPFDGDGLALSRRAHSAHARGRPAGKQRENKDYSYANATRDARKRPTPRPESQRSMGFEGRTARGIHTKRRVDRRNQRERERDQMTSLFLVDIVTRRTLLAIYITNHRASVITVRICPARYLRDTCFRSAFARVISSCDLIKKRSMKQRGTRLQLFVHP